MSDMSQGPGWWQASDGKWYPPEQATTPAPSPAGPASYGAAPQNPYGTPTMAAAGGAGQLASWGERVGATLIDAAITLIIIIAAVFLGLIAGAIADALGMLLLVVGYGAAVALQFYFFWMTGQTGQSPGKKVMGIKVVSEATGQPIGGGNGIIRYFAHIPDGFCLIGYLFPLFDEKKQTFADKIQSTVVLTGISKLPFGPDLLK